MHPRRFPTLIVSRIVGIDDWSGMIPLNDFDLRAVCDDDLVPGAPASKLLREAAKDLVAHSQEIARAMLGFDGIVRSGPYLSVLPTLPGSAPQMITAWRAAGGVAFVASTMPLQHLHQEDNEYAGYDPHGRIIHLGKQL